MSKRSGETYHHGNLHDTLIAAAIELIRDKGPNAFSLRELAKKAGVSHTAPYRHFKDKNALLSAIAETGFKTLTERTRNAAMQFDGDPKRQLIESGVAYVELALDNPEITQLMFGGFIDTEKCPKENLDSEADNAFQGLVNLIESGKQSGVFRNEETELLALATWSMVHGLAMLITGGQLCGIADEQDQVRDLSAKVESLLMEGILVR